MKQGRDVTKAQPGRRRRSLITGGDCGTTAFILDDRHLCEAEEPDELRHRHPTLSASPPAKTPHLTTPRPLSAPMPQANPDNILPHADGYPARIPELEWVHGCMT